MNRFSFLPLLCLFCGSYIYAQNTQLRHDAYIYGKISQAQSPLISIDLPKNLLTGDIESYAARIASDGSFSIYCPLWSPTTANLFHANQFLTLFLFPGDSIAVTASGEQLRETIQCNGKGGERNQFLAQYCRRYESDIAEIAEIAAMTNKDAGEYRYHADQQRQEKLNLLSTAFKTAPETAFFRFAEAKIGTEWANNLFDYPMVNAMKNNKMTADLTPTYYDFLKEGLDLSNPHALFLPRYAELLKKVMAQRIRPISTAKDYDHSRYYADRHELAKKSIDNKPLHFFQAQNIIDALTYGKVDDIIASYQDFIDNCPYIEFRTTVEAAYTKAAQLMAGKPAPDFVLTDATGSSVSLRSLQGKAVYLDFWASWCAPCRAEMPNSKQLYEKLRRDGAAVEFVYISIDENPETWLKTIQSLGLEGKQLLTLGLQSETAQAYNIKGVPRYIIIDSRGMIADSNAKRPSESGTEADILRAIK